MIEEKETCCTEPHQKGNCIRCNRYFRDNSDDLFNILSKIKHKKFGDPIQLNIENADEIKYKKYNYNGSFHKGLQHNSRDGRLTNPENYERLKFAILSGNQELLASVPMAKNSVLKLVNPLASLATIFVGAEQAFLKVEPVNSLSSDEAAAEMLEIYAMAIARDIPFINYSTDSVIQQLLSEPYMNNIFILNNLKNSYSPYFLTSQTIFRGKPFGNDLGPYISQLLYLDVKTGALATKQKYNVPPTRSEGQAGSFRVEWGVVLKETIDLQNGNLFLLPPPTPSTNYTTKYIYSGRSLAEAVHFDPPYQFFYQAAAILLSLGAVQNPSWPSFPNQISFVTNNGAGSLFCMVSDISMYALKHAWYWKWQHYRSLRPETFGLWIEDIKAGLVPNKNNFDISSFLLNNPILDDIQLINNGWVPGSNSHTLPQAYHEGAPLHPSYVGGHATIAGACCTILKMFFVGDQPWLSLPGVMVGNLSGIPNAIVQANDDGSSFVSYTGDINDITINGELNKLAFNVGFGRNWAGIHYRSDDVQGILLGEAIAIHYMEDMLSSMVENNINGKVPLITFRRFDNTYHTVKPLLCRRET